VFALCGFHTYITALGLTTQEKPKHIYDRFKTSPFTYGNIFRDFVKAVFWPDTIPSRVSHELYLKSNKPQEFEEFRRTYGDTRLPDEMLENSVVIYESAFK
jgi:hypothetical protein